MRIYRVHIINKDDDSSNGYEFYGTKKEAQKGIESFNKDFNHKLDSFCIPVTAVGFLYALNKYGGHPNNG